MREHRHRPFLQQRFERSHMVEVTVGQHNGSRMRRRADEGLRGAPDRSRVAAKAGVNQNP
jgi:hypothetical protein